MGPWDARQVRWRPARRAEGRAQRGQSDTRSTKGAAARTGAKLHHGECHIPVAGGADRSSGAAERGAAGEAQGPAERSPAGGGSACGLLPIPTADNPPAPPPPPTPTPPP